MPEGPELNLSAQFVNQTCRGRVFSGKVLKSDVSRQPLVDWNEDAYMISAVSRGKELKLTLQSIPVDGKQSKKKASKSLDIVFQFGMSGKFDFYEATVLQKHAHLNFFTQNNNANQVQMVLSFVDYRRFGKWQPGGSWSPERGPCVLTEYLPFRENVLVNIEKPVFNKPICEVLLNQKYFNGIGNYLRAEICYRAGIKPFQSARSVLEPLVTTDIDIKIKSEKPDILQLCHLLTNQVLNLGGTGYDPENRDPDYSKFTEWLQCYYKDGMKNMADHNKRTMWYAGDPGPMVPSKTKERKVRRKTKKTDKKEKTRKTEEKEKTTKMEEKHNAKNTEEKEKTKKLRIRKQVLKEDSDKSVESSYRTGVIEDKAVTRSSLIQAENIVKSRKRKSSEPTHIDSQKIKVVSKVKEKKNVQKRKHKSC